MIKKKQLQKKIARERIEILFNEAQKASRKNINLSRRYVELARKISTKYKVRIKKEYKKLFCKGCSSYFVSGKTLRSRIKNKMLIQYCYECGRVTRYPLSAQTKKKSGI